MSILFKGNLEEGNYTLIKTTDGWVLKGKTSYVGFNFADRAQGEWIWSPRDTDGTVSGCCSNCSFSHLFIGGHTAQYNYCPHCGARMKGADDE